VTMTITPQVLAELQHLDSDWELIPVDDRKRPIDPATGQLKTNWSATTYTADDITTLANTSPHIKAIGVVLGPPSGGLLAVDFDGPGAVPTFASIYNRAATELPTTVGWCSGLPKRGQLAFRVPMEYWPLLRGRRRWQIDGKTVLELRWSGHQSVIAGAHPDTAGYTWLPNRSPQHTAVADAPEWLLEPLFKTPDEPIAAEYKPAAGDADRAIDILTHIKARDDYDGWLQVGMALHSVDPGLLTHWVNWSQGSANFDEAECLAKWSSFKRHGITLGTLYYLAQQDGYTRPRTSHTAYSYADPHDEHSAAEGTQQLPEKPKDELIELLLEQLIDLQLSTSDTWAKEQALRTELWALGVQGSAIDERIWYALAKRWELPLQTAHNGQRRGRRISEPLSSITEDLIPGFLLWRRDHLLFGAGGTGKTMAAAQMAVCCIKGLPFLDQEIPPSRTGKVLWIGTDGGEGARAMVREYLEDLGHAEDLEVDANLTIWAAEPDQELPSWACTPAGLEELRQELELGGYALVVIDSLKAVFELAGVNFGIGPVGTLMRLMQALVGRHCSLLWLHHPAGGKAAGKGLQAAAGNQNINQIPSAVHQITRKTTEQGAVNEWSVHKLRGSQSREFAYRLSEDGFTITEGQITGNARAALLDAIDLREAQGIPSSTIYLHQEMPQFNESTIRNNLTWLRKRGLVLKSSSNWRLTPQGKKFLTLLSQGASVDHWIVGKAEQ
jgi:hypothetical protein